MILQKAYKYKLKTNTVHEQLFASYAGCCRFVWNHFLSLQKQRLEAKEKLYTYNQLSSMLTALKKTPEYPWLKETYSVLLQQTLRDLDRAIWQALKKGSDKRFPVFKKKGDKDGFRYPAAFSVNDSVIKLPKIKGRIRFFNSQALEGKLHNLTIKRESDGWYCSIQTQRVVSEPVHTSASVIGVDRGVVNLVALSDGTLVGGCDFEKDNLRIKLLQRRCSKKKKFSANWKKDNKRIARLKKKIADKRNDYLHKLSNKISKNHALIVVEDLKVKNITRSAAGTVEKPGKGVRQKAGLNRSILEQGWGELVRQLEYKSQWRGGRLISIPAHYTSQQCNNCGHTTKENRINQAKFVCQSCGHEDHADVNAAKNILAAGHAVIACGERTLVPSVKQEPSVAA